MAAGSMDGLIERFRNELAPFLRQDDFYGIILLPSLIINKKGCHRAVINRHPALVFKSLALSSPEISVAMRRKAMEILLPLVHTVVDGVRISIPPATSGGDEHSSSGAAISARTVYETLFRFCVWMGMDSSALAIARVAEESQTTGVFLRRGAFLLQASSPDLRTGWLAQLPENARMEGPTGLFAGVPGDRILPGEPGRLSHFYYMLFEDVPGAEILSALHHEHGDLPGALERRSAEVLLVWAFLAMAASGRLYWAFRLERQFRTPSGLSHSSGFFHEEGLRIACAAERYNLFRRLEQFTDPGGREFRAVEAALLFGPEHKRRMTEILGLNAGPPDFSFPDDSSEGFRRRCHELFEEILLSSPDWFVENRRYLPAFAGLDLRIRTLLGRIYEDVDFGEGIRHLGADRHTPLVHYRRLMLEDRAGRNRTRGAEKRKRDLKKMLEESPGVSDPGPREMV